MEQAEVIKSIQQVAAKVLPKGSALYLYGSRARGDFNKDSDWDLLILLNSEKKSHDDWDRYAFPFINLGWDINEDISARTFTNKQWSDMRRMSLFYYNVEDDKKLIYES